jgi:eukaryotic-like serine/threonine-protein kinase
VNLGSALSESGKIAEAITMYERAVVLKPKGLFMAYNNLGTAYSRAGRYPDAISAYKKALDLPGNNYMVRGNLAYVYSWMNGMNDQARQTFESAIQLAEEERKNSPRDPFVHSDLALYYAKTGNAQLAGQRLATALALSPDGPEILAAAAEVYELLDQRSNAIAFAEKSLQLGYSRQRLERNPELSKLMPHVK